MKTSAAVCTFCMALAALALSVDGAYAAINYNSSKSNTGNLAVNSKHPQHTSPACTGRDRSKACRKKLPGRMKSGTPKR